MGFFSPTPLALRIAHTLDYEPEGWCTEDRHIWTHPSGVSLWVANKAYGLGLSIGDNRRAEPNDGRLPARDRRRIWRSVNRIMDAQAGAIRRRASTALRVSEAPR